jgi:hypothetical protein
MLKARTTKQSCTAPTKWPRHVSMVAEPHTHLRGFCQHTVEICGRHAACWQYRAATKTQQATADRVTMSGLPLIEDTAFQPTVHARQPHKQQMPTSTCNAPLKAGHCLQNPHLQSLTVMCAADAVPPSTLSHPFARQPSVHAQSSEGCSAVQCSAVQCPAVHTAVKCKVYCTTVYLSQQSRSNLQSANRFPVRSTL